MINVFYQVALTLLSAGTIAGITLGGRWVRWGCVLGLVSEILWFRLAIMHGQVDVFVLSIWYTLCFGFGLWRSFRKGAQDA